MAKRVVQSQSRWQDNLRVACSQTARSCLYAHSEIHLLSRLNLHDLHDKPAPARNKQVQRRRHLTPLGGDQTPTPTNRIRHQAHREHIWAGKASLDRYEVRWWPNEILVWAGGAGFVREAFQDLWSSWGARPKQWWWRLTFRCFFCNNLTNMNCTQAVAYKD